MFWAGFVDVFNKLPSMIEFLYEAVVCEKTCFGNRFVVITASGGARATDCDTRKQSELCDFYINIANLEQDL